MTASTLWVRMFIEKSMPSLAVLGLNYAFVYTAVLSGNVGLSTLALTACLSIVNYVMMCRQRAIAAYYLSDDDIEFKKAFLGLQNIVFALFSGIGLFMVAITPMIDQPWSATSIVGVMLGSGLLLFWSQVFTASAEMKSV